MNRKQIIQKFIDYFTKKNHKPIQNAPLIPENDPTVLFTTAGMQPLVPFLLGEKHPQGQRLVGVQKCIRTGDIEAVGNETHHTFFEMLGNWSLNDYQKEQSIKYSYEFLTKILKIPREKIAVSVFAGNENIPKDEDAKKIWEDMGIEEDKIAYLDEKENWWGPAGKTGPCGPDTEIFYWKEKKEPPKTFNPKDKGWVEIWNNVFMTYEKNENREIKPAQNKNIDTGMGVERTVAALNGIDDNYLTESWKPIVEEIEKVTQKKYKDNKKEMRIIADHIKASVFIISGGVQPSNCEQGYVLRRLIRRAIVNLNKITELKPKLIEQIANPVFTTYEDYKEIIHNKDKILQTLTTEENKFTKTLEKGLNKFKKISTEKKINAKNSFLLYQSYGFPIEMTEELAKEQNIPVDIKGFEKEMEKHQKLSRESCKEKFKSGLADDSDSTKKLHTATHLLNEALRITLQNPNINQKGSNITPERLRFDFNFDRKLTEEEIKEVEKIVNLKIKSNLPIICKIMPLKKAKKEGAKGVFDDKYQEKVKVYNIGSIGKEFSKEICAGPHVKNTSELGKFRIIKQESVGAGVRRIKAILE